MNPAECTIGRTVVYAPPGAAPELGQVVEVRGDLVFVLYLGDTTPKATRPADLHPVVRRIERASLYDVGVVKVPLHHSWTWTVVDDSGEKETHHDDSTP